MVLVVVHKRHLRPAKFKRGGYQRFAGRFLERAARFNHGQSAVGRARRIPVVTTATAGAYARSAACTPRARVCPALPGVNC